MKQIVLNEREKEVIKLQLDEKIEIWTEDEEIREVLMGVIRKARTLMEELNAYEESGVDLILWFWNKYQAQQTAQAAE